MNTAAIRANRRRLLILTVIVLFCAAAYMLVEVDFSNPRLFAYAMKLRAPKLIVMLITAFSIGGASLVFQSIINNTIVTPCLLGLNSLYTLIHTAVVFFLGSSSIIASNANLSFAVDVVLMGITATIIYSWIFKKTKRPFRHTFCHIQHSLLPDAHSGLCGCTPVMQRCTLTHRSSTEHHSRHGMTDFRHIRSDRQQNRLVFQRFQTSKIISVIDQSRFFCDGFCKLQFFFCIFRE